MFETGSAFPNQAPDAMTAAAEIVDAALDALRQGGGQMAAALETLSVPIYTTDSEGRVTYANRACIEFAGRTPVLGEDRWCVTWKLYNEDGTLLPHDECPMAVAIREKRPVRGVEAVAERPDGTRLTFLPHPTPLLDESGEVIGAVNILVDLTDRRQTEQLAAQAERCRRLANAVTDRQAAEALKLMAEEYEDQARALKRTN